jgi:sialate O-acetylesterase
MKKTPFVFRFVPLLLLLSFVPLLCAAEGAVEAAKKNPLPFVSPVFGDNMVLQRGKPNTFWGWARPGEEIRVTVGERSAVAKADPQGRWETRLEPVVPKGNPAAATSVRISGEHQQLELKNVLVGDVWLCGGQSNMNWSLPQAKDGAAEVAAANQPEIRFFKVSTRSAYGAVAVPKGTWRVCSRDTVSVDGGISAVAYYYARRVQAETGVPIGLIQSALGGSAIECWMSPEAVAATGQFDPIVRELARLREKHVPEYGSFLMHWLDDYDIGQQGATWADPALDDGAWKSIQVPAGFAELALAETPAVAWFRREITLPDPLPSGQATLRLGVVEKMETSYVNGKWVGASSWVENPRAYAVPAAVLKPGKNVIAVRVFKLKSKNGFLSAPEQLHLTFADGADIPLAGAWKAKVSVDARPPHPLPLTFENYPTAPTVLYQGMIHPLAPIALKGALWYQGEANSGRAYQYRTLLPALIADWRRAFAQGDLPFLIVSLPAFQKRKDQPGSDDWAELREAQTLTAKTVKNCWQTITIDTGDADNIHPINKKPVGERLAAVALAKVYGKPIPSEGPTMRRIVRLPGAPGAIRIEFDHTDGGLKVQGEKLAEFSVAGKDRVWHWAEAKIEGETVVVTSPEVPEPQEVRYAWQANPQATLFNGAGLPAVPFRSDDWPGVTDKAPAW